MKKLDPDKTAIIVTDMLNDFVEEDAPLPVPGAKDLIPQQQKVLEAARNAGAMVVYIADHHMPDDPEFQMWPKHAVYGTRGAEVIDALSPKENERVIPKRRYSGFFGTDLDLTLREHDIETVVIMGVLTDICVNYTSAGASMRDYDVFVIQDGVSSDSDDAHEYALKHMQKVHGTTIIKSDEFVQAIQ